MSRGLAPDWATDPEAPRPGDDEDHKTCTPRCAELAVPAEGGEPRGFEVECPHCGAQPHQPCIVIVPGGPRRLSYVHPSREAAA